MWISRKLLIVLLTIIVVPAVRAQEQRGVELKDLMQRIDEELVVAQKQELGRPYYRIKKVDLTLQGESQRSREGKFKIFIPFFGTGISTTVKNVINLTFDVNVELKGGNPKPNLADFRLADAITQFRREIQAGMVGIQILDPPKVEFQVAFSVEQSKELKGSFVFNILEIGGEIKKVTSGAQLLKVEMEPVK
jgi:hypothetical protein